MNFKPVDTQVVPLEAASNHDPRAFVRFVRGFRSDRPDIPHTNSPVSSTWGVGVSEAVTESFAPFERWLLVATDTSVVTIPNGDSRLDIDAGYCDSEGILDPYPVEPSDLIIGTVGRHIEAKGYQTLIDTMVSVTREHPEHKTPTGG